jgi:hypothetical protein
MLTISISPLKIALGMLVIVVLLTILSTIGHAVQYFYGEEVFVQYVRLFNIAGEANIPTWFSSFSLAACGLLFFLIAALRKANGQLRFLAHWRILGVIFIYIAIDEFSWIHEIAIEPLRETFNTGGIFYFAWVIPATILMVIFLLAYRRFVFHLPPQTRWLLVASGVVYVTGALGMEFVDGYLADYHTGQTLLRGGVATLEEILEMTGFTLLAFTLLNHIQKYLPEFKFKLVQWSPLPSIQKKEEDNIAVLGED